jgi:hypothetical protein
MRKNEGLKLLDKDSLEKIKMGHSMEYQQYTISRYIAGDRLGWIIKPPEGKPFISRDPEKVLRYIASEEGR